MGAEGVHPESAKSKGVAYAILRFAGNKLPSAYHGFVYTRWLKSLRHGNDFFKLVASPAYYESYRGFLSRLIDSGDTTCRLAVLSDDLDVVLGFSVCRGTVLDYVYVHPHQRLLGIGASLVPADIDTITHLTKTGLKVWGNKYPKWQFNPFV